MNTNPASDGPPTANLAEFNEHIGPLLTKTCIECHGPDKAKAKFRVDTLNPDLIEGGDVNWWLEVLDVLSNGEMPPDDADVQLSDEDLTRITDWLNLEIKNATETRKNEGASSSFRRMTSYEYDYALQDLLGLKYSVVDGLPPEAASKDGFKNNSEMLQMSAMQFEIYREIGLKALRHATVTGERPKIVVYRMPGQDNRLSAINEKWIGEHYPLTENIKRVKRLSEPLDQQVILNRASPSLKVSLSNNLPWEGVMRVTFRAGRTTMDPDEFAGLRLEFSAHTSNNASFVDVLTERDFLVTASSDNPQMFHLDVPLSEIQRNPFRNNKEAFPRRDEFLAIQGALSERGKEKPLEVLVDFLEITAPHYEQWPPKSHLAIFIESENKTNEPLYSREVLTHFMKRAWRRPITAEDVAPFVDLFVKYRPEFPTMEEAMLEVLATVLATPEFLYVARENPTEDSDQPQSISDLELASRLSFFLWSSIPDQELIDLARKQKLKDPSVLTAQVNRMLADPRAKRFTRNFVEQWLGLDGLESATHVKDLSLLESMREEPLAFFQDMLSRNGSIMDFIHSDHVVINERLARHYGLREVFGPHFRQVPAPPSGHRGGILTTAAIHTIKSDGIDSNPLKRGVWMLERILNDPPPPPPPNVPEVDLTDPRILQMTLKERIADHRNNAACFTCHAKIDPWGIAFENYDALGRFRNKIKDKPVDATAELLNKQELAGIDGLKRYLLADRQDQFAGAMVHKMTSYALGRTLSFGDRAELEKLTVKFRERGDQLGDLIHLITSSTIFHAK